MIETEAPAARGRTPLRRRYFLATTAVLVVVGASLSVSFAADSGTSQATVTGSSSAVDVWQVDGDDVPDQTWTFDGDDGTDRTMTFPQGSVLTEGEVATQDAAWLPVTTPGWSVAGGSSGTVGTGESGDLAYLDARGAGGTKVLVSVFVTNMGRLAVNYTSWAFNIQVHQTSDTSSTVVVADDWDPIEDSSDTPLDPEVITSDSGTLNFVVDLADGEHIAITLEEGGSFYTVQTDTTDGDLSPEFFIRATSL